MMQSSYNGNGGARKIVQLFEEIEVAPSQRLLSTDFESDYTSGAINDNNANQDQDKENDTATEPAKDTAGAIHNNSGGSIKRRSKNLLASALPLHTGDKKEKRRLSLILRPDRRSKSTDNYTNKCEKNTTPINVSVDKCKETKTRKQRNSLTRLGRPKRSTSAPQSELYVDYKTGESTSRTVIHEQVVSNNESISVDITSSVILSTTFSMEDSPTFGQRKDDTADDIQSGCFGLERCSTFDSAGDSLMYEVYSLKESQSVDSFNTMRSFRLDDGASTYHKQLKAKKRHKAKYYFQSEDFDTYSWKGVRSAVLPSSLGMAVVATATVIVHPILFLAGAIWAVGMFHAVEHGYKFYSDGTFGAMFWGDEDDENMEKLNHTQLRLLNDQTTEPAPPLTTSSSTSSKDDTEKISNSLVDPEESSSPTEEDEVPPPPPPPRSPSSRAQGGGESLTQSVISVPANYNVDEEVRRHYKPLEVKVMSDVLFPHIHATEFFRVFFSDAAPYSMKDFQEERGDIEINFGEWQKQSAFVPTEEQAKVGFHFPEPITSGHVRERAISFKTLTKSYLGPSYASASTRQRVTRVKDKFIIIENQTQLLDIPYGDRFVVLERWTVMTRRSKTDQDESNSYLTVDLEVKMLKDCNFEKQIRKKTASTMKSYVESWCKKATAALSLAEKQKAERIRKASETKGNISTPQTGERQDTSNEKTARQQTTEENQRLLAAHKEKLHEIKGKMESGEFQYAFEHVETKHSLDNRRKPVTLYTDSFGESGTIIPSSPEMKPPSYLRSGN